MVGWGFFFLVGGWYHHHHSAGIWHHGKTFFISQDAISFCQEQVRHSATARFFRTFRLSAPLCSYLFQPFILLCKINVYSTLEKFTLGYIFWLGGICDVIGCLVWGKGFRSWSWTTKGRRGHTFCQYCKIWICILFTVKALGSYWYTFEPMTLQPQSVRPLCHTPYVSPLLVFVFAPPPFRLSLPCLHNGTPCVPL